MLKKIDHSSPIPLHAQVEQLLRDLIIKPEYKKGKFLPNEKDLASWFGISRNTVRQATNKLAHEGLIIRKNGIGTKVSDKRNLKTKLANWLSFTQEMNENGIMLKDFETVAKLVPSPAEVSKFFGIPSGKPVLRLNRVRGDETGPFVFFNSYFHPRIGLKSDANFFQPLYQLLEEQYHTIVSISKEEIKSMPANGIISKKLDIKINSPVLFRKRYVLDIGYKPVELSNVYYRADRFTYSIELQR
jgi:GntR family transcriptional regulator